MKKFCIVQFEDGLHLVPMLWVSDDQLTCIWPDHFKSQFQINKAITRQLLPENVDDWKTLDVVRIFGEAGMLFIRSVYYFLQYLYTKKLTCIKLKTKQISTFFLNYYYIYSAFLFRKRHIAILAAIFINNLSYFINSGY